MSDKKQRIAHLNSTVCYLKMDNKVLMIKFSYYKETGLTLINPKLQGISYWKDSVEGIIFVYTAEDFKGDLTVSEEGTLEWIRLEDLQNITQFDQNQKFTPYLFKDSIFEGKFLLDDKCKVLDYKIRNM